MSISQRDEHLKQYFPEDIFKQLDEAEKTVLYEEFANSQLRILASQPIEATKAQLSRYLANEFKRRLNQIQLEEYDELKPWYLETCKTVDEIYCNKCGVLLAIEVDTIDDQFSPYHHEGKFVVPIGNKMMAYRPRLDGVMGYQCGNVYQTETAKKAWDKYDADTKKAEAVYEKAITEHEKEAKAWLALPKKKQDKVVAPEAPAKDLPDAPEEPRFIECDNNTLWAQIELDNVPESHVMTSITKEDRIKVKQDMDAQDYAPDVKETKRGKTVETFELRKVK